jgi:hypothetical protein
VNDLGSVGGQDAVFDDTGNFKALEVFAGYMSFQKWWRDGLRSNVIFSVVEVAAIDIGGELLWGGREDKDGSSGDASQAQLSIRYRF